MLELVELRRLLEQPHKAKEVFQVRVRKARKIRHHAFAALEHEHATGPDRDQLPQFSLLA